MNRAEHALQRAVVIYLTAMLLPPPDGAVWRAIDPLPGKSAKEGAQAKALGAKPGWPDLQFIWRGRFIGIELKQPGKTLSTEQKLIHRQINTNGGLVTVCHSLDAVIAFIAMTGIPMRTGQRRAA